MVELGQQAVAGFFREEVRAGCGGSGGSGRGPGRAVASFADCARQYLASRYSPRLRWSRKSAYAAVLLPAPAAKCHQERAASCLPVMCSSAARTSAPSGSGRCSSIRRRRPTAACGAFRTVAQARPSSCAACSYAVG